MCKFDITLYMHCRFFEKQMSSILSTKGITVQVQKSTEVFNLCHNCILTFAGQLSCTRDGDFWHHNDGGHHAYGRLGGFRRTGQ